MAWAVAYFVIGAYQSLFFKNKLAVPRFLFIRLSDNFFLRDERGKKAFSTMKRTFLMVFAVFLSIVGCSKYDDTDIRNDVDGLKDRVAALERLCQQMNTNIGAMQTLVEALQNNDYISDVSTVEENGREIGYKITFNKRGVVIIYHGDTGDTGSSGITPIIGVKQDTDGLFYWTQKIGEAEATWILDTKGNKVLAVGKDGVNGQTPYIGTNGNWWIGTTDTGIKAQGEQGPAGNDGQTPHIGTNGNWWIGTTDTGIKAQGEQGPAGKDGITPQLEIKDGRWRLSVDNGKNWTDLGPAKGDSGDTGAQGPAGKDGDSFFKSVVLENGYVTITLNDSDIDPTVFKIPMYSNISFTLTEGYDIRINSATKNIQLNYILAGGSENASVKALAQDGYRAVTRKTDATSGWIGIIVPDNPMGTELLIFVSDGGMTILQTVKITVTDALGNDFNNVVEASELVNIPQTIRDTITVLKVTGAMQEADIEFLREKLPWITHLDMSEAVISKLPDYAFSGGATSYNGYINGQQKAIAPVKTLKSIVLPQSLEEIGKCAFIGCINLKDTIVIPDNVKIIGDYAFHTPLNENGYGLLEYNCQFLIKLGASIETIGKMVFNNCTFVSTKKKLYNAAFSIPSYTIQGLILENITSIGDRAFWGFRFCDNSQSILFGKNIRTIGNWAFENYMMDSTSLDVYFQARIPPTKSSNSFHALSGEVFYVPSGRKEAYELAGYNKAQENKYL